MNEGPSIGRVLAHAFAAVGARPIATLAPALLFGAAPSHLLYETLGRLIAADDSVLGGALLLLLAFFGGLFLSTLIQGRLLRPTSDEGGPVLDLRGLPSLVGASAAVAAAVTLGLSLALVPGVLVYVMLAVAGSVVVAERRGPWSAMLRSVDLTRGARWRVLGLFALLLAGQLVYSMLVGLSAGLLYSDLDGLESVFATLAAEDPPEGFAWIAGLAQTPVFAVWATAQNALYLELRDWKEGPAADRLAEIFG